MSDSKNIKDELREFAPDLLQLEKQEGFQVPPRYFDRLGDEVIHRMRTEEQHASVQSTSWLTSLVNVFKNLLQPRLAIGLATIALLIIGIQQFGFNTGDQEETLATIEGIKSVTDEEFNSYLAENIFDFEEELLEELVSDMPYIPESIGDKELDGFFKEQHGTIDINSLEELLL